MTIPVREALLEEMGVCIRLNEYKPYARVWVAVLTQAIKDIKPGLDGIRWNKSHLPNHNLIQDAKSRSAAVWMLSTNTSPCSFLWVCDVLGYDPDFVRSKVATYRGNFTHGYTPSAVEE